MPRALLSVYDKTGLAELARGLVALGYQLVSTGGTLQALQGAGLPVLPVSEVTGFPEILRGRVKTLHPRIYGGLLARRDQPQDVEELARLGIDPVELVAVNLYPFEATAARPGVSLEEALENIDIGGPSLLRAAAKGFPWVTVLADPSDYAWVLDRLRAGGPTLEERRELARKAFQHVARYDTLIAHYLLAQGQETFPGELTIPLRKMADLRYGENPQQQAALYQQPWPGGGVAEARQLHGRELSFNNLLDADAAWRVVSEFGAPAAAVVKHTNPCGVASHPDLAEAYRRAHAGDPVAAFGGIVAFNRPVPLAAAQAMTAVFYEVVVAPGYEPEALTALQRKRNFRILEVPPVREGSGPSWEFRSLAGGGLLVQTEDPVDVDPSGWRVVTRHPPTPEALEDLAFAWRVAKHVKSNAVVLAHQQALMGMGAGQPSRVASVRLALEVAGERARGAVLASDAFFPFPDGVELAGQGGVTAIVQPGGSIRDQEVIEAADRLGIAMVFTGVRHFRH